MSAKQNVKLPRKPAYRATDFTSNPMLAMMDMGQLKEQARRIGKRMRNLHALKREAIRTERSYVHFLTEFEDARYSLREVQRAYRKRIENMKARGLL
jgi:hypothetical protein